MNVFLQHNDDGTLQCQPDFISFFFVAHRGGAFIHKYIPNFQN